MKRFLLITISVLILSFSASAEDWDGELFHYRLDIAESFAIAPILENIPDRFYTEWALEFNSNFLFSLSPGFRIGPVIKLNINTELGVNYNSFRDIWNNLSIQLGYGVHVEYDWLFGQIGLFQYNLDLGKLPDLTEAYYSDYQLFCEVGIRVPFEVDQTTGHNIYLSVRDIIFDIDDDFNFTMTNIWDTLSINIGYSHTF
jgi:hypothetical protein